MSYETFRDPYTEVNKVLRSQKYHLIGSHSAVKKCLWVHKVLMEDLYCYKGKFYGIESHRCIQMSVATQWCWNACLHCWRVRPTDMLEEWDERRLLDLDDPQYIVEMSIEEHRRTVSGYKAYGVSEEKIREAMNPRHVAISLTGENTLYPLLGELIKEYHKRGITTFLVTRAVRPDIIANLDEEPSQLYISLESYDKESYEYFNVPLVPRAWEKTLESIEILPSFTCPTVFRITAVKSWNMSRDAAVKFARLIDLGMPTFIEVKAYMHIGGSTLRLNRSDMPTHDEVREFARILAEMSGYKIVAESKPSRVVLLSRLDKPLIRHGNAPISWSDPDLTDFDEYNQGFFGEIRTK
ncbi:MAG: 4-demethylwyosine synthase TYW1 [Sulfolobales archaeon]